MKRIYYKTEETTTVTRKGYIEIDDDFTQVYKSFAQISPSINSPTSWKLLFWLLSNNTDSNGVTANKRIYTEFEMYLQEYGEKTSRPTFDRCLQELKDSGCLTTVGKGHYYLNPHLFWQANQDKRVEFIVDEHKEKAFTSLNPIKEKPKQLEP